MPDRTSRAATLAWLLIVVIVPPAVSGGLENQWVARNPAWAIGIVLVYEALAAVGGFFLVIARDVAGRWQKRLAERLDLFLQLTVSRFEGKYREWLLARLRFTDLKDLPTVGPFTPELDEVFVDVTLAVRPPRQIEGGPLPGVGEPLEGRRSLNDFLTRPAPSVLAIVGGPGTGKSTLLRYTARRIALRDTPGRGATRDLPVLLYLRDHVADITADPAVSLAVLVRQTLGPLDAGEPPQWLERKLAEGRCVVLLDGLDEVARRDNRAVVAAWTENQIRQYPACSFVISSRPQGYRDAPVEGAEILQVCGFTHDQVDRFVHGWYQAAERHSTGASGEDVAIRADRHAGELLDRLARTPSLLDLTANPLLLTMIANVHRYRGALPSSRADLYSEICQVMLWRRQEAKQLPAELSGDKQETVLQHLAYAMMRRGTNDISWPDALAEVEIPLRRFSTSLAPDGFLTSTADNGFFTERETEQYAFAHKSFQEYLAAVHIRKNGLIDTLVNAVNDDWWRETTLLYAAKSDADLIVGACLKADTVPALALAFDCADQASAFDPALRARLDDILRADPAAQDDPERRHLMAAVSLSRHLHQRFQSAAGAGVCTRPVTNQIYTLFLADTANPAPDTCPEDREDMSGPAAGVRGRDAAAFVQWANSVSGDHHCRLLTGGEADELAARQRDGILAGVHRKASVWTQPDPGGVPALWSAPGSADRVVQGADVRAAAERDVSRSPIVPVALLLLQSRILADDLDRAVDLARGLEHARDLLAQATGLAPGLPSMLDDSRTRALDFARSLDTSRARDLQRTLESAIALALAGSPGAAASIAGALGLDHARVREHLQLPDAGPRHHVTDADLRRLCGPVTGRVLAHAGTSLLRDTGKPGQFPRDLCRAAGIRDGSPVAADPDSLARWLEDATDMLTGLAGASGTWPAVIAGRLRENASPVFSRSREPTEANATAIRMASLCLAGESDMLGREDIGGLFRRVAAGITLLEQRRTGQRQATEVILLAVD